MNATLVYSIRCEVPPSKRLPDSLPRRRQRCSSVLVNGSLTDYRMWQSNLASATSIQSLGDGSGGSFSVQQHAEDLAFFPKTLNLGKVHLLGWSRGGSVVVEVAKHHPEIVRTLISKMAASNCPSRRRLKARRPRPSPQLYSRRLRPPSKADIGDSKSVYPSTTDIFLHVYECTL